MSFERYCITPIFLGIIISLTGCSADETVSEKDDQVSESEKSVSSVTVETPPPKPDPQRKMQYEQELETSKSELGQLENDVLIAQMSELSLSELISKLEGELSRTESLLQVAQEHQDTMVKNLDLMPAGDRAFFLRSAKK